MSQPDETGRLLDRFAAGAGAAVPLTALWAHGSLALGDYQPGRSDLDLAGLVLRGPAPATVVPPVTDQELAGFIRADLRAFWYPHTGQADLWLRDEWVDVGLLTFARATVTLRDGRLITKREALAVLARLGAPDGLVRDIYQRRYENPPPVTDSWRAERAEQARTFFRRGIRQLLALPDEADR